MTLIPGTEHMEGLRSSLEKVSCLGTELECGGSCYLPLPDAHAACHTVMYCTVILYLVTLYRYTAYSPVLTPHIFSIKVQYNLWLDGALSLISWMFLYEIYRNYTSQLYTVPAQPILHVAKLIWPVILGFLNCFLMYFWRVLDLRRRNH